MPIESLEHIGALEMLVVFSRKPVKGQSFFYVLFDPHTEARILFLPAQQPGRKIPSTLLRIAPIVKPAQFRQAIVGDFAGR